MRLLQAIQGSAGRIVPSIWQGLRLRAVPAGEEVNKRDTEKRHKAMDRAVKQLQTYVGTYTEQAEYRDYSNRIFVDDILYGLGLSMQNLIPSDFHGASGYERFKQYLREHLK